MSNFCPTIKTGTSNKKNENYKMHVELQESSPVEYFRIYISFLFVRWHLLPLLIIMGYHWLNEPYWFDGPPRLPFSIVKDSDGPTECHKHEIIALFDVFGNLLY